jgi:diaminohydroxyphosphoribosylaminopyrimidine deaminase/5-amino-6-(5-phosphoribosylamino)uracil reductase
LRSRFDGILVGQNTLIKDSPSLDCRIEGLEQFSPKRFCASSIKVDGFVNVGGSVNEILQKIYENNVQHLLVEGGANIVTQFMKANLFDEVIVVQAPIFLGNDGISSMQALGLETLPLGGMKILEKIEIDNNIFIRLKNKK